MSKTGMPKNELKTIRRSVKVYFHSPSQTKQEYKESQDINNIIKRYQMTGELPIRPGKPPLYGDVSNIPSFREALDIVNTAQDMFQALPAKLRSHFSNDPQEMLSWASDPANHDEAVELGLIGGDTLKAAPTPLKTNPTQLKEDSKINNQETQEKK